MKLTKLSLANFRGFEHLELGFNNDVNVIAGENGIGKSSSFTHWPDFSHT